MTPTNRNLLALALGMVLASPAAYAQLAGVVSKTTGTVSTTVTTPTATTHASDAVSAKATVRESGRMKDLPANPRNPAAVVAPKSPSPPGKGNWFAELDIDGDGQLSGAEAKGNAGLDSRFGKVDANTDGFVTLEEYRKFYTSEQSQGEVNAQAHSAVVSRDVWLKLDANADGKLSSSEVATNTGISGVFSAMDGNGDGFVTQAEYRGYTQAHR